ncbi:sensor histidine kinase [Anaerobium acetethylicum]|uniref:histidine kinase n=1 Tax=Anaerobium acetethylicum TaxID=1619234 RepID=A0A1D3TQ89_9FIRM|nr:ATP-binding protein [Anaerobium acetethylicum]SCP95668.1 two-component system, OmpR family, sensor histidine kinase KdpD [Anaerobium acetethylicum]
MIHFDIPGRKGPLFELASILPLASAFAVSFIFRIHPESHMLISTSFILAAAAVSMITGSFFRGALASLAGLAGMIYFFSLPLKSDSFPFFAFPFAVMLVNALIISRLVFSNRVKDRLFREKQEKADKLTEIGNELLSASGFPHIINLILEYVREFLNCSVIFYQTPPRSGIPGIIKSTAPGHKILMTSYHEKFIVQWVFDRKEKAGVGTDFCGRSSCTYLPLVSHNEIWGVLGIYREEQKPLEKTQLRFLNSIISQAAMAIERQHLSEVQQQIKMEAEKENMRANLLRAVSHDLRTPLTGIIGSSTTLLEHKDILSPEQHDKLLRNIHDDSNWLLHMVENLLSVTRIREEGSTVNKIAEPLEEVVSEAVMRIKKRYPDAVIQVRVPDEFLMVPMDATLIEQVLINLTENAIVHSESKKPTELYVDKEDDQVIFHIRDYGIGLMNGSVNDLSGEPDLPNFDSIFEGYSYKKNKSTDSSKGIGIGLSICKTIITAHGGTITAGNHKDGGAHFTFSLPLEGGTSYAL